ncbi:MAG: sigma-70 family RNA polymerase sigma factor [Clostridia bacterium]|nr:sigma-70 family RNA polymerase sigma factor [Clostridia bacterium]
MEQKVEIKKYMNNGILNLEKIVDEYSGYVYKIAQNMTNGNLCLEDIEEIISDTFFILWKNTNKLDEQKLLSSYIAGITKNLVREKTRIININYDISDYENSIEDLKSVDMLCEERERKDIIKKSLKKMKEEDIEIFNLYYYSSMKIKEIARVLNIPEFKVKSRLHRVRKKIKKELEKGGYSYDG